MMINKIMGMKIKMMSKKIEILCLMTKLKVTMKKIMMINRLSLNLESIMMISLRK